MKDVGELKEQIARLEKKRKRLIDDLMEPGQMVAGSLYKVYRKCGKPGCRCAKGEMHGPFACLSTRDQGRRKVKHIRQGDEDWVARRAAEYRRYQKRLAQLRKIDARVLNALKGLRNAKVKTYT
jgi:hypothetical protein